MREHITKPSKTRLSLAIALLLVSVVISVGFTLVSSRGDQYWVAKTALLPGTRIDSTSIELASVSLGKRTALYFPQSESPELLTAKRFFAPGEIISRSGTADLLDSDMAVLVPLSIRSADIPENSNPGDTVSLFWVLDTRNEELFEPEEIARDIFIKSINRRGTNFGSDLAVTVSVSQSQVQKLLSYTSGGRIVVVPSHG